CSEHRLERVIAFADTLITVEQGRVSGGSVPDAIRDAVLAPPLVQLGRLLQLDPLPLTIRDARRATNATREKLVNRDSDAALERNTWPAGPAGRAAPAIRLQGVSVYRGQHRALTGVNLEAAPGQVVAIMGRNGSGKSTLLGALAGLYRPAAGRVRVGGQNPAGLPAAQLVRRIALLPQEPNLVLYGASARHEASTADRDAGLPPGTTLARWSDLAGAGTEAADPDTHPRDLSEGQRLALALAVLLAPDPPVVAVDEPTRGLDYLAKNRLVAWLARLATDGRCVLVATHDVEFAAQCANRVVQLADGEVVLDTEATRALATSPAFAPQVAKVLRPLPILTVEQLSAALEPDP
ncbi:MAG: cobalt ABC transporter ATP-binding protein, partial [Micrococcales bacterium]